MTARKGRQGPAAQDFSHSMDEGKPHNEPLAEQAAEQEPGDVAADEQLDEQTDEQAPTSEGMPEQPAGDESPVRYITLRIPVAVPPPYPLGGAHAKRVEHQDFRLTLDQREAWCMVYHGLDLSGARTDDCKRVHSQRRAWIWLIEQITAQLPECVTPTARAGE